MKIKTLITIVLVIVAIALFLKWSAWQDDRRAEAVQRYETCVLEEYNTTPTAWYLQNGEYPECDPKIHGNSSTQ